LRGRNPKQSAASSGRHQVAKHDFYRDMGITEMEIRPTAVIYIAIQRAMIIQI
jgi:hypothetical protein